MSIKPRRLVAPERQPPLKVIPGGGGRSLRAALILAAAVVLFGVFAVAGLQAYLSQEGFRAAELERSVQHAEEEYAMLRAEVARLSTPSRLGNEAEGIGMEPAEDPAFIQAPASVGDVRRTHPDEGFAAKRLLPSRP